MAGTAAPTWTTNYLAECGNYFSKQTFKQPGGTGAPEVFLQPPPGGGATSVPVPAGGLRCWLARPTAASVATDSLEPCPGVWTVREC